MACLRWFSSKIRHLDFIYSCLWYGTNVSIPDKVKNTDLWSCTMISTVCLFVVYVTGKMVHSLGVNASSKVDDILCCKLSQVSRYVIASEYTHLHLFHCSWSSLWCWIRQLRSCEVLWLFSHTRENEKRKFFYYIYFWINEMSTLNQTRKNWKGEETERVYTTQIHGFITRIAPFYHELANKFLC